jgi:hypothetical protein
MASIKPILFSFTTVLALNSWISFSLLSLPVSAKEIAYKPVVSGVPTRRVGAGNRGVCKQLPEIDKDFSLQVLVPEHLGQTIWAQPTLYWSLSKPINAKFSFTLGQPASEDFSKVPEPLVDETWEKKSVEAGIHALSLEQRGVSLVKNTEYEWSISIECDPNNPSANIVAKGTIKRVEPAAANLQADVKETTPAAQLPYIYAENGLWYDALQSIAELIEEKDKADEWTQVRASLLGQQQLTGVTD